MPSLTTPFKASVVKKTIAARLLGRPLNIFFLVEYPKSGGTWLKYMLAHALGIPAWDRTLSPFQSCLMQAHWTNSFGIPLDKTVIMHRDGRDIMVSFYYHSYFYNDLLNGTHVDLMKRQLPFSDYEDIRSNLLPFMKFVFDTPVSPKFSWSEFVNVWHGKESTVNTTYEALRLNTSKELVRILSLLQPKTNWTIELAEEVSQNYSMKNMQKTQAIRNKGIHGTQLAQKPFIRKGSVGGWNAHFTDEALEWFENKAGSELVKLGYELGRPNNQKL